LEWLDSERQKSNSLILEFKDQIADLEGLVEKQRDRISFLENELKNYTPLPNRITQLDEVAAQQKVEFSKQLAEIEKKFSIQIKTVEKQQKEDVNVYNKRIAELQTVSPMINELKKQFRLASMMRIVSRNE
jgi:uncharacterized coiled-coil protein SlyX